MGLNEKCAPAATLPFHEGEAPVALPLEGATRAPIIARHPVFRKKG
jgi:hypothetical protein